MTFLSRPGKDEEDELFELPELTEPEIQDAYNDTRLQTYIGNKNRLVHFR